MTAALAWIEGLPLVYIFVLAIFAFAMIAFGLNQFSNWQHTRTPADKVRLDGLNRKDAA